MYMYVCMYVCMVCMCVCGVRVCVHVYSYVVFVTVVCGVPLFGISFVYYLRLCIVSIGHIDQAQVSTPLIV